MYEKYVKRILDFTIALIAIAVLSPLMLVLAVLVGINLGTPILFKQTRIGKDEKPFTMCKFRTMTNARDESGNLLPDVQRQTKLGKFLRGSSMDELPELFNILKGDISIVGPRPLLEEYLPYYTEEERLRHSVRGGLTVPEVMLGKVNTSWTEQFACEVYYAKNVSFLLDLKIIFATFRILFKRVEGDFGSKVREPLTVERRKQDCGEL